MCSLTEAAVACTGCDREDCTVLKLNLAFLPKCTGCNLLVTTGSVAGCSFTLTTPWGRILLCYGSLWCRNAQINADQRMECNELTCDDCRDTLGSELGLVLLKTVQHNSMHVGVLFGRCWVLNTCYNVCRAISQ